MKKCYTPNHKTIAKERKINYTYREDQDISWKIA